VDGELALDADLYYEVGVESTRTISILVALEERFGITIDDSEFVKSRSVNSLADLVRRGRP
jgi:acyl carrier protein